MHRQSTAEPDTIHAAERSGFDAAADTLQLLNRSHTLVRRALATAAEATADAARRGLVVHMVLQVGKRQRIRSQLAVSRIGAGDRAAHQIHVASIHVITTIAGKQAALLANALIATVGLASAGVAVGVPRGAERDLHAAAHLAVLGHALGDVLQRFDGQRAPVLTSMRSAVAVAPRRVVSPSAFIEMFLPVSVVFCQVLLSALDLLLPTLASA